MPSQITNFHNFQLLIRSWKKLCKKTGLSIRSLCELDGFPIFEIRSPSVGETPCIYISAGIHGDEPAGIAGLLEWALEKEANLTSLPLLLYPCLNPWGYLNNSRLDLSGIDLNRVWNDPRHRLVKTIGDSTSQFKISLSVNLHEDYDGQGIYLYEPQSGGRVDEVADKILLSGETIIKRDPRKKIDGRIVKNGIIRPKSYKLPEDGFPEALYLYKNTKGRSFTFETPSEYAFENRVNAHKKMIECAVQSMIGQG